VGGVVDRSLQELAEQTQRLSAAQITPRVSTLAHGSQAWAFGSGPEDVGPRGVGLQSVRQHVKPRRGDDLGGKTRGAVGVDERLGGTQRVRSDAGLRLQRQKVEDRDARYLAAG